MKAGQELLSPCGLYCGVCAIRMAHRDGNWKFKERLAPVYGVTPEMIRCEGCLSQDVFEFCRVCPIKDCTQKKGIEGCHQCEEFPCGIIDNFPIPVGKKVMLRAIPQWRELGTGKWVEAEEARYRCPSCGADLFRGARRCRACQQPVDLD